MPKLIKDGQLVDDSWQLLPADATSIPAGKVIVPMPLYLANQTEIAARSDVGVWLNGDDNPATLGTTFAKLPLVAVNFPAFMDGRGFSTGRLIRERFGFTGELRAIGNLIRDQLCYLHRCGFTAFALPETIDPAQAVASLQDFKDYYQASVDQPLPLFRRRG